MGFICVSKEYLEYFIIFKSLEALLVAHGTKMKVLPFILPLTHSHPQFSLPSPQLTTVHHLVKHNFEMGI